MSLMVVVVLLLMMRLCGKLTGRVLSGSSHVVVLNNEWPCLWTAIRALTHVVVSCCVHAVHETRERLIIVPAVGVFLAGLFWSWSLNVGLGSLSLATLLICRWSLSERSRNMDSSIWLGCWHGWLGSC